MVAESHGFVARRAGALVAIRFLDAFRIEPGRRVVWADEELTHVAAERWLRGRSDKAWSLTDAVSFEVMKREGVREAFAFDVHFEQAGFSLLA